MDKYEARVLLPLFQAFANGRKLQRKLLNGIGDWEDVTDCDWQTEVYEYRIKPKKRLVPFTFKDREFLKGKWVKKGNKDYQSCLQIIGFCQEEVLFFGGAVSYSALLEFCKFEDGTPCGKYVEE